MNDDQIRRRAFLIQAGALLSTSACVHAATFRADAPKSRIDERTVRPVSQRLQREFAEILTWAESAGWLDLIDTTANTLRTRPTAIFDELPGSILQRFDDFAGQRIVEPGKPQLSLLYHVLAHPLIKLPSRNGVEPTREQYPELLRLDVLENYIYGIDALPDDLASGSYSLVVMAYEYRPWFKTPHEKHADLVFSRTGISRIGKQSLQYDRENRCFSNGAVGEKDFAVTAARYALFLAKQLRGAEAELSNPEDEDKSRKFLLPCRKVFSGDLGLKRARVAFGEQHRNDKLHHLANFCSKEAGAIELAPTFDRSGRPFMYRSATFDRRTTDAHRDTLVDSTPIGSSVLVHSVPTALVRRAEQAGRRVRVRVPGAKPGEARRTIATTRA